MMTVRALVQAHVSLVLTESGGVQEETTYLGVSCLTARKNSECPVTVTAGTDRLVESRVQALVSEMVTVLKNRLSEQSRPELWDGMASGRIVASLQQTE